MVRNIISDVVVKGKKSFPIKREEIILRNPASKTKTASHKITEKESDSDVERVLVRHRRHMSLPPFLKKPHVWMITVGVIVLSSAVFFLGAAFSGASIEITQKTAEVSINTPLTASKSGGQIPFELIMVKGSENKTVQATGVKDITRKASGRVIIYNNYSSASQKLVANTRLEASGGKIYRISSSVTVPGISGKNGNSVPGSVEVTVYADQAGAEYNSPLTDFTIPGFKGDPRYNKFYGRSKTEITGGFSGKAPVSSDKDLSLAKTSIESSLRDDLFKEASSQIPEGYILYKDAVQIDFEEVKDVSQSGDKTVTLRENGTLVGIMLKTEALKTALSGSAATAAENQAPFDLVSPENLKFSFKGGQSVIDAATKSVDFSISGKANLLYLVDKKALSEDLSGKKKADFQSVLSKYPSVYKARIVSLKPFWARYFPSKPEKISITIAK